MTGKQAFDLVILTTGSRVACDELGPPKPSNPLGGLQMTCDDRIQRSCSAPSANRYPYCGCDGCLVAYRIKKRQRRRAQSQGDYVCQCGHRFQTLHGLRAHRGKVHSSDQAVA